MHPKTKKSKYKRAYFLSKQRTPVIHCELRYYLYTFIIVNLTEQQDLPIKGIWKKQKVNLIIYKVTHFHHMVTFFELRNRELRHRELRNLELRNRELRYRELRYRELRYLVL